MAIGLTPTSIKTGNYTAAAGDLVLSDVSSMSLTHTLPTSPADQSLVGFHLLNRGTTNNVVVIKPGGTNKIISPNVDWTQVWQRETVTFQFQSSTGIWYPLWDSPVQLGPGYVNIEDPVFGGADNNNDWTTAGINAINYLNTVGGGVLLIPTNKLFGTTSAGTAALSVGANTLVLGQGVDAFITMNGWANGIQSSAYGNPYGSGELRVHNLQVKYLAGTALQNPVSRATADIAGTTLSVDTIRSWMVPRSDSSATGSSSSSTITDTAIQASDQYSLVTGTNIPSHSYVGAVSPGTNFTLVNSTGSPVTPTGSVSGVTITPILQISDTVCEYTSRTGTVGSSGTLNGVTMYGTGTAPGTLQGAEVRLYNLQGHAFAGAGRTELSNVAWSNPPASGVFIGGGTGHDIHVFHGSKPGRFHIEVGPGVTDGRISDGSVINGADGFAGILIPAGDWDVSSFHHVAPAQNDCPMIIARGGQCRFSGLTGDTLHSSPVVFDSTGRWGAANSPNDCIVDGYKWVWPNPTPPNIAGVEPLVLWRARQSSSHLLQGLITNVSTELGYSGALQNGVTTTALGGGGGVAYGSSILPVTATFGFDIAFPIQVPCSGGTASVSATGTQTIIAQVATSFTLTHGSAGSFAIDTTTLAANTGTASFDAGPGVVVIDTINGPLEVPYTSYSGGTFNYPAWTGSTTTIPGGGTSGSYVRQARFTGCTWSGASGTVTDLATITQSGLSAGTVNGTIVGAQQINLGGSVGVNGQAGGWANLQAGDSIITPGIPQPWSPSTPVYAGQLYLSPLGAYVPGSQSLVTSVSSRLTGSTFNTGSQFWTRLADTFPSLSISDASWTPADAGTFAAWFHEPGECGSSSSGGVFTPNAQTAYLLRCKLRWPISNGTRKVYLGVQTTVSGGSGFYVAIYQYNGTNWAQIGSTSADQSAAGGSLRSTGVRGASVGTAALAGGDIIIMLLTGTATSQPEFWARPADLSMVNAGWPTPGLNNPAALAMISSATVTSVPGTLDAAGVTWQEAPGFWAAIA